MLTDATTAEKLEGTSRGVHADPLAFPPPSLPRLPLFRHPCFTHSLPYSSFLLHLNCKLPTVPSEKWQPATKLGCDRIHLVPTICSVVEDASHRVTHGGCTHERLKPSFSANSPNRSLPFLLLQDMDSPRLFTVTSEHIRF